MVAAYWLQNSQLGAGRLAGYLFLFMNAQELQSLITAGLPCEWCRVEGDGRHWYATVVSASFEGKRLIQRHQQVYGTLGDRMQTDEVHALSIKTHTPAEWARRSA